MSRFIIFTHIPKTSGTSFVQSLIVPNYPARRIGSGTGVFGLALVLNPAIYIGHTPYGLHRLTWLSDASVNCANPGISDAPPMFRRFTP